MSRFDPKSLTIEDTDDILHGIKFKTTPMHHQAVSLIWAAESDSRRIAYFHGVGVGKSLTALYTHQLWGYKRMLIVCPNSVVESWAEQIQEHTTHKIHCLLQGTRDKRKELLADQWTDIFVLNYEGLQVLFGDRVKTGKKKWKLNRKYVEDAKIDALIFDECHKLKSEGTHVSEASYELSRIARQTVIMTGTPIATSEEDLWSQFHVLNGGVSLGASKKPFLMRHFKQDWWRNWDIKTGQREVILDRVAPVTLRYSREECFDLPDRMYETRHTDMSAEQRRLTESLVTGQTIEHEGYLIEDTLPMIVGNKLAQVAGGFLKFGKKHVWRFDKNPKMDLLQEAIAGVPGKLIVFHGYVEEGRAIEERLTKLGIGYESMRGETDKKGWIRFKESKDCKVLVAHPESGGVGINLQVASTCIFYSNACQGATVREQAEGRIWRLGQERPCLFLDLVMRGSIDERRLQTVESRADMAEQILSYIQWYGG